MSSLGNITIRMEPTTKTSQNNYLRKTLKMTPVLNNFELASFVTQLSSNLIYSSLYHNLARPCGTTDYFITIPFHLAMS